MLANSVLSLVSILSRVHPDLFKHKLLSQICIFFFGGNKHPYLDPVGIVPKGNTKVSLSKDGLADLLACRHMVDFEA